MSGVASWGLAGWNVLDCAVALLGWVDIALPGDEYTILRSVRVLRPLRTITHIRGLKVSVTTARMQQQQQLSLAAVG